MHHKYSLEEYVFIKNTCKGKSIKEITKLFNEHFNTDLKYSQIKSYMKNNKLTTGISRKELAKSYSRKFRIFTNEQEEFIKNNAKGLGNKELTLKLNEHFGTNFKVSQIDSFKNNHHINSGLTGQFEKGHTPANKGKKVYVLKDVKKLGLKKVIHQ